jgi:hypothetical protein
MVQICHGAPQYRIILTECTIIVPKLFVSGACGTMASLLFDDGMLSAEFDTRRCVSGAATRPPKNTTNDDFYATRTLGEKNGIVCRRRTQVDQGSGSQVR